MRCCTSYIRVHDKLINGMVDHPDVLENITWTHLTVRVSVILHHTLNSCNYVLNGPI